MKSIILLICFLCATGTSTVFAQMTGQTVSLWLGGKSGFYGIGYEQIYNEDYIVGSGLGTVIVRTGKSIRTIDYQKPTEYTESGTYTDISFMTPFYGGMSFGDRHRFNVYAGLTLYFDFYFTKYPSGKERNANLLAVPFIGTGYELRTDKYRFNSSIYLARLGPESGWLPPYIPWLGIGFGRNFIP